MGSRGGKKRERLGNSPGLLSVLSVCPGGGGVGGLGFERRRVNILPQFCLVHSCEVNANARAVQAMFTRIANVNASVRNRTSTHAHLE